MTHPHFRFRRFSRARTLALAVLASTAPLSSAIAQSLPQVRVTDEGTTVRAGMRGGGDVLMRPAVGAVLDLISLEGDRYQRRDDNWYLVVLPRDAWGASPTGWVSGRDVELLPQVARQSAAMTQDQLLDSQSRRAAVNEARDSAALATGAAASGGAARPTVTNTPTRAPAPAPMADIVLNFEFGKSELTDEAKAKLSDPAALIRANTQGVSFAVEGHADWVGSERFNERLGLARAERVKRYLAEERRIPADKMSVVSYGEAQPAASNDTDEGRVQNRRVVLKVRP